MLLYCRYDLCRCCRCCSCGLLIYVAVRCCCCCCCLLLSVCWARLLSLPPPLRLARHTGGSRFISVCIDSLFFASLAALTVARFWQRSRSTDSRILLLSQLRHTRAQSKHHTGGARKKKEDDSQLPKEERKKITNRTEPNRTEPNRNDKQTYSYSMRVAEGGTCCVLLAIKMEGT